MVLVRLNTKRMIQAPILTLFILTFSLPKYSRKGGGREVILLNSYVNTFGNTTGFKKSTKKKR